MPIEIAAQPHNPARAAVPRMPRRSVRHAGWQVASALVAAIIALPIVSVALIAMQPATGVWPHLLTAVIPVALRDTVLLLGGVLVLSTALAVPAAWAVSTCHFPGRRLVDIALVLPLAIPTYITAFCYIEVFDYTGPLQTAWRGLFGFTSFREYWFPSLRSLGGAIFVLALALYPYIYVAARTAFSRQSAGLTEAARTLGRDPRALFWSMALPLARPALIAGAALVLMETLADIGAVTFLGVNTLAAAIYSTWLERSSLAGAAQLALILLLIVFGIVALERRLRADSRFHDTTRRQRALLLRRLGAAREVALLIVTLLPAIAGFGVPLAVLIDAALAYREEIAAPRFLSATVSSLILSASVAVLCVVAAIVMATAARLASRGHGAARQIVGLGYALPGTVVALGLLVPLGALDRAVDGFARGAFGVSTGLILSGSVFALVLACAVRFITIALSTVDAAGARQSPNLDAAARSLGASPWRALRQIHLPLLNPALAAAMLLVFVDCMKELPATLLLRPFNFDTLATSVFAYASLEQFERSAPAALAIVAVGLLPLIILQRGMTRDETAR